MESNRHGVPLYRPQPSQKILDQRGISRPGCVWPGCPKFALHTIPLCGAHTRIVAREAHLAGHEGCEAPELSKQVSQLKDDLDDLHQWILQPKQPRTKRDPDEQGWIYYIRVGEHYKIGYARDVRARIKGYPPTCELLAAHRGAIADERALHQRFSAHRVAGREWYLLAEEITDYIESVKVIHGRVVDMFKERQERRPQPVRLKARTLKRA